MINKELTIDLENKKFDLNAIPNLNEITEIRFRNYTNKIEIPLAINEYPNITKLSFSGKSDKELYETPDNLENCVHIKDLEFSNSFDFAKMKSMPHLEKLIIQVKNTETDTRNCIALFPNLKFLKVWGRYIKDQIVTDEIGCLSSLEFLVLESCGLSNLPNSIVNLKKLKEFTLTGCTMDVFPEQITQLENLEVLKFEHEVAVLPDSLSNLKKLKTLDLNCSLNWGNACVASRFEPTDLCLKPIPEVIGKLENLENLNLGTCGVFDITPIISLKKLKKLNLQFSALKDCEDFSNFPMLEDLDIADCYDIQNLNGLKGLPLKKLNLFCNEMTSIAVISSLEKLETLNIDYANTIKDYSPIYNHTAIKELIANDTIVKKWKKQKNSSNKLPELDTIISQFGTDNLKKFEENILHLSKHIEITYSDDDNPLAGYFDIEADEEEITEIEILDSAIQKHIKNLSDKTFISIFGMTFKSVGNDNYQANLIVLEEIISRKNIETQLQIIKKFQEACQTYEAGHRYWGNTVYDQLIDSLFPQFTSEALYELLKDASTDLLNRQGGDGMDVLFVPAFQNTTDEKLLNKLLKVFYAYQERSRGYLGKDYFDKLFQNINDVASPKLKKLIAIKNGGNKGHNGLITLLEELREENLPQIIDMLGNEITDNLAEKYLNKIKEACTKVILPETSVSKILSFLIKTERKKQVSAILISQYHTNNPQKIIDLLKTLVEENTLDKWDLLYIFKKIISELTMLNTPFEELKPYEDFMVSNFDMSYDQVYNIELEVLLEKYFDSNPDYSGRDFSWISGSVQKLINKTNEPEYRRLWDSFDPTYKKESEKAKLIFYILYPKVKQTKEEGVLYRNLIASVSLNDEPFFDLLYNEVKQLENITEPLLAYNLACALAHFRRKEEMLVYIKESIQFGKMKQQFMDDIDFKNYWEDADFLNAFEEK